MTVKIIQTAPRQVPHSLASLNLLHSVMIDIEWVANSRMFGWIIPVRWSIISARCGAF
jgi:hypothetical protein